MDVLSCVLDDSIELATEHGVFAARHATLELNGSFFKEGVVLLRSPTDDSPLQVRPQSSCLFSEAFRSDDCDCAAQLQEAMRRISVAGGLIVYLYDEGRGIGLRGKMKAIRLQQTTGSDTKEAFHEMGLAPDPRLFAAMPAVVKAATSARRIELLTNNPKKIEAFTAAGFEVASVRSLVCLSNDRVARYFDEKTRVLGHLPDVSNSG